MNSKDAVGQIYGPRVTTKSGNVCALCAVCPGGMYRQCFCGGLAMVIAVNVGDIWELPRLSCLRWDTLWSVPTTRGGVWGLARPPRVDKVTLPLDLTAARDLAGGVAGAEPPHKGGPNRPDRQTAVVSSQWSVVSGQWSVVSGQWSVKAVIDGRYVRKGKRDTFRCAES